MKTIAATFDKIAYSRAVLKWGTLFAIVAFSVSKCTGSMN